MLWRFPTTTNDARSADISAKINSQLEIKRKNGDFIGSFAVYGYLKSPENKNRLIIDDYAAEVVRDIFKWVAAKDKPVYLFSGVIVCGDCKRNMVRKTVPEGGMLRSIETLPYRQGAIRKLEAQIITKREEIGPWRKNHRHWDILLFFKHALVKYNKVCYNMGAIIKRRYLHLKRTSL